MTTFIKRWTAPYCTGLQDACGHMDRARSSSPRSPLHPGSRQWASASPQRKQERPSGSRASCAPKNPKSTQHSSPRSPISEHFPLLLLLSQLRSRFPKNRSPPHRKKTKKSTLRHKSATWGIFSEAITLWACTRSRLLVILLSCKVQRISLMSKEIWAKPREGTRAAP